MVTEKEIWAALNKGARTTADIQRMTSGGTSCGRCLVVIDNIVEEFLSRLPVDPQQQIDFDF
jgi:bacterioferritin-associated ferredoxin